MMFLDKKNEPDNRKTVFRLVNSHTNEIISISWLSHHEITTIIDVALTKYSYRFPRNISPMATYFLVNYPNNRFYVQTKAVNGAIGRIDGSCVIDLIRQVNQLVSA